MRDHRNAALLSAICSVLLTVFACLVSPPTAAAGSGSAATPTPPPRIERPIRLERLTACTDSDKLEITYFLITPSEPVEGQVVTIVMKIKNKCPRRTASLNVPWEIRMGNSRLADGTVTLGPGETRDMSALWTAVEGTFIFFGNADPGNTVSETDRNNNTTRDRRISVASSQAGLATKLLEHIYAKDAGAGFTANPVGITPCTLETNGGIPVSGSSEQVQAKINCTGWPAGGRGDFEGYLGFTLKNGWRVKSYVIPRSSTTGFEEGQGRGWSWGSPPPSGTNPYYKLHLWTDGFHGIEIFVKITIEGPQGTNPYQ